MLVILDIKKVTGLQYKQRTPPSTLGSALAARKTLVPYFTSLIYPLTVYGFRQPLGDQVEWVLQLRKRIASNAGH